MNEIEIVQDFLFYNSEDGSVKVQVLVDAETETIWATQKAIAELFGVTVPNISYHLKNIFQSGELESATVIKEILIPAQNGARGLSDSKIKYYNLDAIISVGYRVNSILATNFRIWATKVRCQESRPKRLSPKYMSPSDRFKMHDSSRTSISL